MSLGASLGGGAVPPQPRTLRVLALHSFRTSGAIFEQQARGAMFRVPELGGTA